MSMADARSRRVVGRCAVRAYRAVRIHSRCAVNDSPIAGEQADAGVPGGVVEDAGVCRHDHGGDRDGGAGEGACRYGGQPAECPPSQRRTPPAALPRIGRKTGDRHVRRRRLWSKKRVIC
jgi:hypothetical protein